MLAREMVFKVGDPATDFYVVKEGEVEILSPTSGKEEVIAILGSGDFLGRAH